MSNVVPCTVAVDHFTSRLDRLGDADHRWFDYRKRIRGSAGISFDGQRNIGVHLANRSTVGSLNTNPPEHFAAKKSKNE